MKNVLAALVYTGLVLMANPALADPAAIRDLRTGDMKKLIVHPEPKQKPAIVVTDLAGATHDLSEDTESWKVVNFWATWCAPCRKEMPTLANLQSHFEGQPVEVVTIATGRNNPAAITKFFDEIGVDNLPDFVDPKQKVARDMGVIGLPLTVILDPQGQEIGRLIGDADWDSDSAIAILDALSSDG